MKPVAPAIALACLAHMEHEEAMLAGTLESLREVRSALLDGDLGALKQALDQQAHTARAAEELRRRRVTARAEWAAAIGVPANAVTLAALAARLPADTAERLDRCRARLKQMAAEVEQLNRGNAALVRHSLEFLHEFFVSVTGGEHVGDRYRPSGALERTACGTLFEGRG